MEPINNPKIAWTAFGIAVLLFVGYVYYNSGSNTRGGALIETASVGESLSTEGATSDEETVSAGATTSAEPTAPKPLMNMAYIVSINNDTNMVSLDWTEVYTGAEAEKIAKVDGKILNGNSYVRNGSRATTEYLLPANTSIKYGGEVLSLDRLSALMTSDEDPALQSTIFNVTLASDLKTIIALNATSY